MARNEEKQLARLNRYYLEKQKQGNLFFVCICMCLLEWESQLPACDPHICFLWHPYIINKITSKANRTLGLLCRTRTVEGLNSDRNMTKCSKQKANLASKIPGLHSKDRRATQNSSPFIILVLNTEQHKNSSFFFVRTTSEGPHAWGLQAMDHHPKHHLICMHTPLPSHLYTSKVRSGDVLQLYQDMKRSSDHFRSMPRQS